MSLFGKRANIAATHMRATTVPDGTATFTTLGTVFVALPNPADVEQIDDFMTATTGEFIIMFDPGVDLRRGDFLDFLGSRHEVQVVRQFVTGKRTDYAEADVVRKEIPEL